MLNKRRKKRVKICLIVVAICIVLAGLWAVLVTPKTALAKKPGGGGGDAGNAPVCVTFRDWEGDGFQSDNNGPYCDDKQLKVEAIMTQDGHVNLQPNTGRGEGRFFKVYIDLYEESYLKGWRFLLGGWQDTFDMRDMYPGEERYDVNLLINAEAPPNNENVVNWLLTFDPSRTRWGIDYSDSTYVMVKRGEDPDSNTWTIIVDDTDQAVLVLQKQVKNKSEFIYGGVVIVPPFTATVALVQ